MFSVKCGKSSGICPVSLGFALGVTGALTVFVAAIWAMYGGASTAGITSATFMEAFWALVKGFVYGFFIGYFYDMFVCKFGKKSDDASCK